MDRVAFIRNNTVIRIYLIGAIGKITKANFKTNWQEILHVTDDEIQRNWIYNPETGEFSSP